MSISFKDFLKQSGGTVKDIQVLDKNNIASLPQKQGFVSDAVSDIKQIGTDSKQSVISRAGKVQDAIDAGVAGKQGSLRTTAQVIGQGAGVASDIIGNIFKGVVKAVLPQGAEDAVKSGITSVVTPIAESEVVKNVISKYNSLDEKTKRDIDAALGVVSLTTDLAGAGVAKKGITPVIETGLETVGRVGSRVVKIGEDVIPVAKSAVKNTKNFATGIKDVAEMTARGVSKIPGRVATNVAESKSVMEAIKQLPTKIAKTAVQNGVDIDDVKYLYQLPKQQKQPLKQLFTAVKDFTSGTSKTNPIEVVGKPIVQRINNLKSSLGTIGQKLGAVAETLGSVTTKEVYPEVFNALKKVPGLNGLKVTKNGLLDFTDTVLTTAETSSDRKAIQQIFTDAIKAGTGKQKHLLRQELFEVLGGKKGARIALTETQDKAYQAIRQGLSNVLDTKNSTYKLLNSQYSKVIRPLNEISRFMKLNKFVGAGDDILNMNAGLLARRLTSNAGSNPEIRNILRALDDATKQAGKTTLSVENLQDFYNVLDKYYDIAAGTGLQKQVGLGIEKASGLKDALFQAVGSIAGKTDAVKMKAIEDAIIEALK